jgi:hypothetical protein
MMEAPYFGCLSVCLSRRFLLWMMEDVDFGDNCSFMTRFKSPGNDADDAFSSWKMDVLLWNEKKASLFVVFGTSMMILQ